ncbi:MAG TPA: hypothetical protein VF041_07550 [Gemmatimonadaceae bacterium]
MRGGRSTLLVSAAGLLRGRELAGEALVALEEEGIALVFLRERVMLPLGWIEGARRGGAAGAGAGAVQLFLRDGDLVELAGGAELDALVTELGRRVLVLPELTLSLRALGSRRGAPGEPHDRWFAPLLAARRAAEHAPEPDAVRRTLDAAALGGALTRVLREMAAARWPDEPAEHRALEAELLDAAAAVLDRLGVLERAQASLAGASEEDRYARWREWTSALREAYASADACWPALHALMTESAPRVRPSRWRRWLGVGRGRGRRGGRA